ncbi:hypothetical protein P256_01798 [Acinetobacter nectaris CIP 110549]|uniref:L-asparaginase N-terminal domain-containing protein n=1 Tax=Acinetobacter nectaris CIP 110549 TaxID=1392540 RepID=V2TLR3_9GAMM|nr:asparaginase domain-containing protein [Acinetobacter nectaris]ESK38267.1 hypothetical protein P256_01798 [Acinetobacter nectaris CIP 110549]
MEKTALIYMGGTFGCVGTPLEPMSEHEFIPKLQSLLPKEYIHSTDCFAAPHIIDSSASTAVEWLQTVKFIQDLQTQYNQFVIIHGTDTLSYASAVCSYFLAQSCCTILTGSQYPLLDVDGIETREETDAFNNLVFALEQVKKCNQGVYLAFNQHLYYGHTAIKHHTTALHAFEGISSVTETAKHVTTPHHITEHDIKRSRQLNIMSWMMQPISVENLASNLNLLLANPPQFLVLQGFGTGNISTNQTIVHLLKQLREKNCLPILTTQVTFGAIDQRYAISAWVKDAQIIATDTLGHADLYAKILRLYLKYETADQCYLHWSDAS